MAAVNTLQALHGLSDSETVDAVTFDLRWKTACGMAVTATAFHATTLTYWRRRLAASDRADRIFVAVKTVVAATGVLSGKTRRALDCTVLDDADATQDTVTQLIGAIRRVRREIPESGPVIAERYTAHDYDDPGKPTIAWNDKAAREQLIDALVGDAHRLLGHLPESEHGPKAADALALLALIAGQDVETVEGSDGTDGRWRIARQVAPERVISTVDTDARHAHKTVHRRQDGYTAHIAIEPDTGIITDCEDQPVRVLGDSAYGTGDARAALATAGHAAVIKPFPLRSAIPGGFTIDDFTGDFDADIVQCPAHIATTRPSRSFSFERHCRSCPSASRCTTAVRGRKVDIGIHEQRQRAARAIARDPDWQDEYRQHRPIMERSIAWLTRGNRKVRYRSVAKNDHWLHHRAAALNLRRLIALGLERNDTTWAIA